MAVLAHHPRRLDTGWTDHQRYKGWVMISADFWGSNQELTSSGLRTC